jgi:RNA polymerase sigma-70 factor (ECF subfamily)
LDHKPDAAETASHDDELALLAAAIHALPERCREVLVLRKLHGLSQKQIAEKLGISENTVAAQASFGVRRCMEYFRDRKIKK